MPLSADGAEAAEPAASGIGISASDAQCAVGVRVPQAYASAKTDRGGAPRLNMGASGSARPERGVSGECISPKA